MVDTTFSTAHVFSASRMSFYAVALKDDYIAGGTWPPDPVEITEENWQLFIGQAPAGKKLGSRFGSPVWVDSVPAVFSVQELALQLLPAATVNVLCTADSSLNGQYAADAGARGNITGIAAGINAGLGLPSGEATFNYLDSNLGFHDWDAGQFLSFAAQVMAYIYNLTQVSVGVGNELPSDIVTI